MVAIGAWRSIQRRCFNTLDKTETGEDDGPEAASIQ